MVLQIIKFMLISPVVTVVEGKYIFHISINLNVQRVFFSINNFSYHLPTTDKLAGTIK